MPAIVDRVVAQPALEELARELAKYLRIGDVVAMHGDLGTGKTTFVRAVLSGLGWSMEVPSPTFTLAQVYELPSMHFSHFDLYRLTKPHESLKIGIEEAFADGVSFVEWPDRLGGLLPDTHLDVMLAFTDLPEERRVVVRGGGTWGRRLADLNPAA